MCTFCEATYHTNSISQESSEFWSNLGIELLGAIVFLFIYETIIKNAIAYYRTCHFNGVFLHCDHASNPTQKNGQYSHSIIRTSFFKPYKLYVVSKDYLSPNVDWTGHYKIDPDSLEYATGTYKYLNQNTWAGIHHLFVMNKDVISVSLTSNTNQNHSYLFVRDKENKSNLRRGGYVIRPLA